MRKLIVVLVLVLLVNAAANAGTPKYSAPNFGQLKPLWPEYPSSPQPENLDQAIGNHMPEDEFLCVENSWQEGEKVFFRSTKGCKWCFYARDLTKDPRGTEWWNFAKRLFEFGDERATSLWQAVKLCAGNPHDPAIIHDIIRHMVKLGIVQESQFKRMTGEQIADALKRYTDDYWNTWTE